MNILGISAYYHDSAACLVQDGRIVAAAQEERFTRTKHDAGLPRHAIAWCLEEGGVAGGDLHAVVFYDKPLTKLARLLDTYASVAPRGLKSFLMAIPTWIKEKAWIPLHIERFLVQAGFGRPRAFYMTEHHQAHAASAFYPSPYREAAILTVDGVGEWSCSAIGVGEGSRVRLLFEQRFPHSVGLLYSAFTHFAGFEVNSGEYKLMGLAPYGEPNYVDLIKEKLVDIREDGSIHLNVENFGFLDSLEMTNGRFSRLFGGPPRRQDAEITRREMDLARSIQVVTEEILLKMVRYARAVTGKRHLCLAGGVALNCVANGRILRSGIFDNVWIQPAAGDAGGAIGAALYLWHHILEKGRPADDARDGMRGALLGPRYTREEIRGFLEANHRPYTVMTERDRPRLIAELLCREKVVGLFQGRLEFGPRALGNRSIIADARNPRMQSHLNLCTKFRESFRPFAPIVLREDVRSYFQTVDDSPYMLLVDELCPERRLEPSPADLALEDRINKPRSDVPAITHVDYSARVQTVDRQPSEALHAILRAFKDLTGYGILVNTSFNVRDEPIVCTPEDAYRCFMRTGIDYLVLEDCLLDKQLQPAMNEVYDRRQQSALD
jgi:carbamoyltransferase